MFQDHFKQPSHNKKQKREKCDICQEKNIVYNMNTGKEYNRQLNFFFFFFFATLHMYFLQFINDCKSFLSTDLGIKKFLARRQIRKQEIYEDTCARVHTQTLSLFLIALLKKQHTIYTFLTLLFSLSNTYPKDFSKVVQIYSMLPFFNYKVHY